MFNFLPMHSLCSVSSTSLLTLPCSFTTGLLTHISTLGRRNQHTPGHGIYWCGHQPWVASQRQDRQEGTEVRRCVRVRVLISAQLSHPQGEGREGMNLSQEEAQSCSDAWAPVFHTFSHPGLFSLSSAGVLEPHEQKNCQ